MKGVTAALAGIAMLGLAGVANAEEASGKVVSMEGGVLILEDGTSFTISEGVSTEGLHPAWTSRSLMRTRAASGLPLASHPPSKSQAG